MAMSMREIIVRGAYQNGLVERIAICAIARNPRRIRDAITFWLFVYSSEKTSIRKVIIARA
jgi:hypothetical protein